MEGSADVGSCCLARKALVTASKIWIEGEGSCEMLHAPTALLRDGFQWLPKDVEAYVEIILSCASVSLCYGNFMNY